MGNGDEPLRMPEYDRPTAIVPDVDSIRDDIYIVRVFLTDEVLHDRSNDRFHSGRDDDDGDVVRLAPLITCLESFVELDACESDPEGERERLVSERIGRGREGRTVLEVLLSLLECLLLSNTIDHLPERVPTLPNSHQSSSSFPNPTLGTQDSPESLDAIQDIKVKSSPPLRSHSKLHDVHTQ